MRFVGVDTVGARTWEASLRALRPMGRLVTCGATSGPEVGLDIRRLFWFQWSLLGSTMGSRAEFAEVMALARQGKLWPLVDSVVELAQGAEAYRRMDLLPQSTATKEERCAAMQPQRGLDAIR